MSSSTRRWYKIEGYQENNFRCDRGSDVRRVEVEKIKLIGGVWELL